MAASDDGTSPDKSAYREGVSNTDYYVLSSEFQGTTRLALQQYIWQQALGFNVHPSIPELKSSASIADVACGTCLWLIEVGRKLGPSSDLHGFDLILDQAPPKPWLPRNVNLHYWNIFEDVPEGFAGKFDLVHLRLISVAVKQRSVEPIMQNLYKLLKPGGYLQWDEVDTYGSYVLKAFPDLDAPATDAWCRWMSDRDRGDRDQDWKIRGVELLQKSGFQAVNRHDMVDMFLQNMELMRYNNDQLLMLTEQWARRMYASDNKTGIELLKTVDQAAKEAGKGAIMMMPPFCWVARRPE